MTPLATYDDALAYHTAYVEAMPRWQRAFANEARGLLRLGDVEALTRLAMLSASGLDSLIDDDGRARQQPNFQRFAQECLRSLHRIAQRATTAYVSERTIDDAQASEGWTVPEQEHVAVPVGFAHLAKPVSVQPANHLETPANITGLMWAPLELLPGYGDSKIRVSDSMSLIIALTDVDRSHAGAADEMAALWGSRLIYDSYGFTTHGKHYPRDTNLAAFQVATTIWQTAAKPQGRLTTVAPDQRRTRKAARREGLDDPSITVIHIASEIKRLGLDMGDRHGPRKHPVRGHYRRQPYGPRGSGNWRWTYIEQHERGSGPRVNTTGTVTKV